MSLISKAINNLLNGVSQQSPDMRSSSQAETQINAYSNPLVGLTKRPPSEHVATLPITLDSTAALHIINRDETERYQVAVHQGQLSVFNLLSGAALTVNAPSGLSYLQSENPSKALKFLTVEDYTFITNTEKTVGKGKVPFVDSEQVTAKLTFDNDQPEWAIGFKMPPSINVYVKDSFGNFWPVTMTSTKVGPTGKFCYFRNYKDALQSFKEHLLSYLQDWGMPFTWNPFEEQDTFRAYDPVADAGVFTSFFPNEEPQSYSQHVDTGSLPNQFQGYYKLPLVNDITPTNSYIQRILTEGFYLTIYPNLPQEQEVFIHSSNCHFFLVRPGETTTHYPGIGYDRLLDYPDYPAAPTSITDPTRGLMVNGHYLMENEGAILSGAEAASYYAGLISGMANIADVTVLGNQLTVTAVQGKLLSVSPVNYAGLVKVNYTGILAQERLFIVVKSGVAEQTYKVSIDGHLATYTSPTSDHPQEYTTSYIAGRLATTINGWSGYVATVYGNFVMVTKSGTDPITFDYTDSWGGAALYAMKNRVQAFEDLPAKFVPGVPIEVNATNSDSGGYYVQYVTGKTKVNTAGADYNGDNQAFIASTVNTVSHAGWNALEGKETGVWEECAKPETYEYPDPLTMPHALIRKTDGTFSLEPLNWDARMCGDRVSVPDPSFIGTTIEQTFFFKNRLGFLTKESLVLSKSGKFFTMFPDSAKQVLDSDPIDISVVHTKVANLHSAVVFNNALLLFSDFTQFLVASQGALTPRTISVQASTEFDNNRLIEPVNSGYNVYFAAQRGNYTNLFEYYVLPNQLQNSATNVTSHVPRFLPSDVRKLTVSPTEDIVIATSESVGNHIYVYKYTWNQEQKVQDSWSYWVTPGQVLFTEFVNSRLYLVVNHGSSTTLEFIDFQTGLSDDPGYRIHLDTKVKATGVSSGGNTVVTLPYPALGVTVVDNGGNGLTVVSTEGNTVTVQGVHPQVTCGFPYAMTYTLSPIYMRDNNQVAMTDGNLLLRTVGLNFSEGRQLQLSVGLPFRSVKTYQLTDDSRYRQKLRVPVQGNAKESTISVADYSHYPLTITGLTWEGTYTVRSQRV